MPSPTSSRSMRCAALVALVVGLAAAAPARALDLDAAKQQGLVGEMTDGYVGAVSPDASADVRALVSEVNAKRRAAYADIARKNGTDVKSVAGLAAQKLIGRAPSGAWVGENGRWYQKQ